MSEKNVEIMGVKLPPSTTFFKALIASRDATPEELIKIQDELLFPSANNWLIAVARFYEIEHREDPELLLEHLFMLQEAHADISGLCKAIFRRTKSDLYIKMLEAPADDVKKKPIAHDAREYYARKAGSSLEGLEDLLEKKGSYLLNRIMTLRNSSSRY